MPRALSIGLLALIGCSPGNAQTLVPDEPSCGTCQIQAYLDVVLGDVDGPGAIWDVYKVRLDHDGRYWIISLSGPPIVFDSAGAVLPPIGRRGEGPGEFRRVLDVWSLPADSIAIFELGGRLHLFDNELRFIRTVQLSFPVVRDALVVNWPNHVLVHAEIPTSDAIGFPFHHIDLSAQGGAVLRSFGGDGRKLPISGERSLRYLLAESAHNGTYWAASQRVYRLSRYSALTPEDEETLTIERRPKWFSDTSDLLPGGPNKPASPALMSVREDSNGLIWTYSLKPSPHFAKAWAQAADQIRAGAREIRSSSVDTSLLYYTHIEVLDPTERRLLASHTLDKPVLAVLRDGRLAFKVTTTEGGPAIRIVRLRLVRG